jgi:hypothetical protein
MTDDDIRAVVRDAIARHVRADAAIPVRPAPAVGAMAGSESAHVHSSHGRFVLDRADADDACLIEPAVRCTHCGYCQSYGH